MRKDETRKLRRKRPDDRSEIAAHHLEETGAPIAASRQAADPPVSAQSTYGNVDDFAREMLKTKRGIGMTPPFYAETASMKGNQSWPYWIVRNTYCNSLGRFLPKEYAERVAAAMNKVSGMENAKGDPIAAEEDTGAYYVLPEDALQFLPRPALGLRARSLGRTLLRELAIEPEVAAAQAL
jgi:hypothetical protein